MPEADAEGARFYADQPQTAPGFFLKGSHQLDWGMKNRLARVFSPATGRTVMLAVDHGYFQGPTTGLERIDLSIVPLLPFCDALFCTRGILRSVVPAESPKPMVLRASGGPSILREDLSDEQIAMDMEDAVRLNAAGIGIQVFIGGEHETRSIHNMTKLVDAGLRYGMPVMGVTAVGKNMVRDAKYFRLACRIIAELGAQYVKTYYVDDGFETVTASCPVPIVMAGGKKLPELEALTMAYNAVQQGAAGVDMGRNIFQSDAPYAMISAVHAVVHENLKHYRMDGADHRVGRVRLEDVAAHIHASGALLDGIIGHGERLELGQFLAAGHHDRHRAGGGHGLEAVVHVIGLDVLRAELGDDAAGKPEVFGVAHHVLAHRRDAHHRHAVTQPRIHELGHVVDGSRLVLAANEHLNADAGGVEPDRVLHVHGDLLIGQVLAQDARAAARAQHHGLRRFRRNDAAQDPARAEQGVAERQQRHDREIDALEAGGRALEVAVVDGEHHGAAGRRAEHARKPVLHAPIELVRALEEETGRGLRLIRVEPCTFGVSFWHEASRPVWLVGVYGVLLNRTTCRPAISVLHFRLGQFASGRSRPTG